MKPFIYKHRPSLTYLLSLLGLVFLLSCSTQKKAPTSIELIRKPYLQMALADSITVLWRTDKGHNCKLAYREAGSKTWTYTAGRTRLTNTHLIENEVTLRRLTPDATYEYQFFTNEQRLLSGQELWFTAPLAATDSVFSFFAVGDIGEPVNLGGTPDLLGKALQPHIDSLRFGLLLGDIIYPDGKSELYDQNLFQYFGNVFPYVPVFTILGNHDWHEPDENYVKEWKLPGNEHYYSFDYGNVHFIGLDTKNGEMYDYEKQLDWFEKDLAGISEETDWRIVFLHHNGKSCTYKDAYEGVVSLYPLFAKYKVDLVLNGHAHTYERLNPMDGSGIVLPGYITGTTLYQNPGGFVPITVGSGGKLRGVGSDPKPFTPDPENCDYPNLVAAYTHQWAFLNLKVNGRTLTGTVYTTEDQKVVDKFVVQK